MDKNLSVRLNQEEFEELEAFCRMHKVSKSDAIRQMILLAKREQPVTEKSREEITDACVASGGL